jgi:uncharacterized lipoprotein YmbA
MKPISWQVTGCFALLSLAGCAAPPLTTYTLSDAALAVPSGPLGAHPRVIEIARVAIPDALDSEDIVLRNNNILQRSTKGRLASRLSLEITALVTSRLAGRYPGDLVTDVHQPATPAERVLITISTLDLTTDGHARLVANWMIIPQDPAVPVLRDRVAMSRTFSAMGDGGSVSMETALINDLADEIRVP